MRKILILAITLLVSSLSGHGQENFHPYVNVGLQGELSDGAFAHKMNAGLVLDIDIAPTVVWRTYLGFLCGVYPEMDARIRFGIGAKMALSDNVYLVGNIFTRVNVVGSGSQNNGDYMAWYSLFNLGLGYQMPIAEKHALYLEVGAAKEFTILNDLANQYSDYFGWFGRFGYLYRIN